MQENGVSSYRRYLLGDTKALETLVAQYSDALVRFACCLLHDPAAAEDIAEDSFVALIVKRRHFKSDAHMRAYLFKTARNKCMDYLRAQRRNAPLEEYLVGEDVERTLAGRERARILYGAMNKLPAQYQGVLYLTYIEGFTAAECAHILKKTTKQIYNLLSRAKAALRNQLEKEGYRNYENL